MPEAPHDLALLTQLAGAIFREVPGGVAGLPSPVSLPPAGTGIPPGGVPLGGFGATAPSAPASVPPSLAPSPDLPNEASLRALVAPAMGFAPPATPLPSAAAPVVAPPVLAPPTLHGGIPMGGLGATAPSAPSAFSPAPVSLPALSSEIPNDASLRALLAPALGFVPFAPGAPSAAPQGATPNIAPPHPSGGAALPGAAFLSGIPPLSDSIPGEADLRALLGPPAAPAPGLPGVGANPGAPRYYFLEAAEPRLAAPPALPPGAHPGFDAAALRADFPILSEQVNGRPLIWLDNAATTQKPRAVIERLSHFYSHENSNIHRAAHELAARATDAYESAREAVRRFLGASSADNIVFVRGATEGINLVAKSWGSKNLSPGDEILITWLEHHANIVPWQQIARETGAKLRVAPVDDSGQVLLEEYERLLNGRTKLVAFTHVSNALGTVTPVSDMVALARRQGAHVLVDGAQSVSHMPIDVADMDCDWFVLSGHKMFAPTGIGVVYGKASVWQATPPWQGGGNMIRDVTFEKTEYQDPPGRFEAGTGNIADAAGLGAAIEYLERIGMENIARYEHDLLVYATQRLVEIPGLRLIGTAAEKAGVLSFILGDIPPTEVGRALNQEGIAVRAGHHCAQPILRRFGLEATVRPSLAFYNTHADIDALADAVRRLANGSPRTA
jgi:cysteine desulfurase/selenocysteine lyase